MTAEGAGGLSTTTLDSLLGFVRDGEVRDAARADLAALVEVAGRVGPLRAALGGLLGGIDRDDRPHPGQSLCRGLHTLELVDEAIALIVAGAGPGAAGARDETAGVAAAEAVLLAVVDRGHRARCPRTTAARGRVACTCGVDTVGDALAALRARGADS